MQQGERVIVKLDPDYNPTGKPMPDTILEQMKADPDYAKLSEAEKIQVIKKVQNLIKDVEDIDKYGTLSEKIIKVASLKSYNENKMGVPFIILSNKLNMQLLEAPLKKFTGNTSDPYVLEYDETAGLKFFGSISNLHKSGKLMFLKEGSQVNAGQCILNLIAIDATPGSSYNAYSDYKVAEIKAPISGSVFSLVALQTELNAADWGEDLFIVSNIPDDTREEAIKWYKETTGKTPRFKTNYDKRKEAAEQEKNVDDFLSKWNL